MARVFVYSGLNSKKNSTHAFHECHVCGQRFRAGDRVVSSRKKRHYHEGCWTHRFGELVLKEVI